VRYGAVRGVGGVVAVCHDPFVETELGGVSKRMGGRERGTYDASWFENFHDFSVDTFERRCVASSLDSINYSSISLALERTN
jgi:hypothetical protein